MQISEIVFPGPKYAILGPAENPDLHHGTYREQKDLVRENLSAEEAFAYENGPLEAIAALSRSATMHSIHLTQAEEIEFKGSRYRARV
jgi:hypothetical protein